MDHVANSRNLTNGVGHSFLLKITQFFTVYFIYQTEDFLYNHSLEHEHQIKSKFTQFQNGKGDTIWSNLQEKAAETSAHANPGTNCFLSESLYSSTKPQCLTFPGLWF